MKKAFNIPTIFESLMLDIASGEILIEEAAFELHKAGFFPYVPSNEQTRQAIRKAVLGKDYKEEATK